MMLVRQILRALLLLVASVTVAALVGILINHWQWNTDAQHYATGGLVSAVALVYWYEMIHCLHLDPR